MNQAWKMPRFLQSLTNTLSYKSAASKHLYVICSEKTRLHEVSELFLVSKTGRQIWQFQRKAQHLP